jgi:hypothetical protein
LALRVPAQHRLVDRRWPIRAQELLGLAVRIGEVEVGIVCDVLCARDLGHVLGLEVRDNGRHSFLPWVAAEIASDHIAPRSVYSLLSATELALYVDNGVSLAEGANESGRGLYVEREGGLRPQTAGVTPLENEAA